MRNGIKFSFYALIGLLLFGHTSLTWSAEWQDIGKNGCEQSGHCRVVEANATFEITLQVTDAGGMKTAKGIEFKNLADGSVKTFVLDEMNDIDSKEVYEVKKFKARPDSKDLDIAVHAFNSAREGKVYVYFVYDASKKAFVQSEGTFPKLVYDDKAKQYLSEIQGHSYILGADLKFTEPPEKSTK